MGERVGRVIGRGVLAVGSNWAVQYAVPLAVAALLLLLLVQDVATRASPEDADSRIPTAPGTVWPLSVGGKLMQLAPAVILMLATFGFGMWASGQDQSARQFQDGVPGDPYRRGFRVGCGSGGLP
jgi:hypothetical protein